jgi:glycosyltransferase involved in cell wall biosynthesis
MKVLLLLPYALDTAPSQRYRIEQWAPHLRRAGVTVDAAALLSLSEQRRLHGPEPLAAKTALLARAMARRLAQLRRVRHYDAVWLHRAAWPIGPALVERYLARQRVPLIFEFDDAIFIPHTATANHRWKFAKFAQKTGQICRLASHVVVGNGFLAEYARKFNSCVSVIPTTVDTDLYRPRSDYAPTEPPTIGWSGSVTTLPQLHYIDGALLRVAVEEPVQLRVVGVTDFRLRGIAASAVEWRAERQVAELSRFDVGVMPMPDDEFSRGKCGCKALEYMAVGVPTVASPVGVNAQIICHRENGLLANTEDEWLEYLLALVRDADLRQRLGRAGRQTVEEQYSARVQAPRVLEVLREVAGSSRRQVSPVERSSAQAHG